MTKVLAKVSKAGKSREVEFLVDSGASYTLLPQEICREFRLKPMREAAFTLADGTTIKRKISEIHFEYKGLHGTTPVIIGEKGDEALLGALTLEILGLVLNPFKRELISMKMMLA
ncbi:MAG: retroviral-like aspartic protease family protein [Candidatus Omnitrophota bacterium]